MACTHAAALRASDPVVPRRPYTPLPQAADAVQYAHRREGGSLHIRDPRIPDCGGPGARRCVCETSSCVHSLWHLVRRLLTAASRCRKRVQGSPRKAHHPAASAACHSRRRRARHTSPRDHRRRRFVATAHHVTVRTLTRPDSRRCPAVHPQEPDRRKAEESSRGRSIIG